MESYMLNAEPSIYRGREHSEVAIPLAALMQGGKLNIFEQIRSRGYFQIYSRGDEFVFQCGGFIGLIPLNASVAIDIAPRIRISNLDRVISKSKSEHILITLLRKQYAVSEETAYLTELLADTLIQALEEISDSGKYKEYVSTLHQGLPRSGKILMKETLRLRAKSPGKIAAATARFERTADNPVNACLKLAVERLILILTSNVVSDRKNAARVSKLNTALRSFDQIWPSNNDDLILKEVEARLSRPESLSLPYLEALPIAQAVLGGLGPGQLQGPGSLSMGSLIFDLAGAFEGYLRQCLRDSLGVRVLDGNLGGQLGGKRQLFSATAHQIARRVYATPDILLRNARDDEISAVFDVKYKAYDGIPDRADINQAVSYAVLYGCRLCGLIFLSRRPSGIVEDYGMVGNIKVVGISFAVGADDLMIEEQRFVRDVSALIDVNP